VGGGFLLFDTEFLFPILESAREFLVTGAAYRLVGVLIIYPQLEFQTLTRQSFRRRGGDNFFEQNSGAIFLNHGGHKVLHGVHGGTSALFVFLPPCTLWFISCSIL